MDDKTIVTVDSFPQICTVKSEQETCINWLRTDKKIRIETSDITVITRLKNIMKRDPDHYICYYYKNNYDSKSGKVNQLIFETDLNLLTFRIATTRSYTEEQKAELKKRFRKNKTE